MDVREKMIEWRKENHITLRMLSNRSGVSETLLSIVERGEVTHPKIVEKIQKVYKLTDSEAEELLPENYRKSSPKYDPNKFVPLEVLDNYDNFIDTTLKVNKAKDEYDRYEEGRRRSKITHGVAY